MHPLLRTFQEVALIDLLRSEARGDPLALEADLERWALDEEILIHIIEGTAELYAAYYDDESNETLVPIPYGSVEELVAALRALMARDGFVDVQVSYASAGLPLYDAPLDGPQEMYWFGDLGPRGAETSGALAVLCPDGEGLWGREVPTA